MPLQYVGVVETGLDLGASDRKGIPHVTALSKLLFQQGCDDDDTLQGIPNKLKHILLMEEIRVNHLEGRKPL